MSSLLTIEQLAAVLHKSVETLKSDRYRAPERLPPAIVGIGRRILFRQEDVDAWLQGHVVSPASSLQLAEPIKRRRGRPTKAEQMARRQGNQPGRRG